MIEILETDDWICVKVNGVIISEGHSISGSRTIEHIAKALDVEYLHEYVEQPGKDPEADEKRFSNLLSIFKEVDRS